MSPSGPADRVRTADQVGPRDTPWWVWPLSGLLNAVLGFLFSYPLSLFLGALGWTGRAARTPDASAAWTISIVLFATTALMFWALNRPLSRRIGVSTSQYRFYSLSFFLLATVTALQFSPA